MQGCKCFFIVARSISVILYCLIPIWQRCNMERGGILLPKIATDYPNKLLPCLARYTVSFLPWKASALDERKIRARRIAPPRSRSCVPVLSWCHSRMMRFMHERFPRFFSPLWREELGNEVVSAPNPARATWFSLFLRWSFRVGMISRES